MEEKREEELLRYTGKGCALFVESGGEDVEEFVSVLFLGRKSPSMLVKGFEHFVRVQGIIQHSTPAALHTTT